MAIDTPARLAILGAGPMGLEVALYARFLGYDVDLFEQGQVAENVRRWGHVPMFSPFGMNRSPLGLAALRAQDSDYRPPHDTALLTGHEWIAGYLEPLSQTDLLADHLRLRTKVLAIGRPDRLQGDDAGTEERRESDFRILVRDVDGHEFVGTAQAVIDTTGVFGNPNWLGAGGLPAIGESVHRQSIAYGLPDPLGRDRARYAGRRTLVVGDGLSAATTVVALANLAQSATGTRIVWLTRRPAIDGDDGPVRRRPHDPLVARDALAAEANQWAARSDESLEHRAGSWVDAVQWSEESQSFAVRFSGAAEQEWEEFDRIVAQVGYRPDEQLNAELQLLRSPLHGVLLAGAGAEPNSSSEGLSAHATAPEVSLSSLEPDYYILGAKSFGRHGDFLMADGWRQIRELFAILGDRPNLDLYAHAPQL